MLINQFIIIHLPQYWPTAPSDYAAISQVLTFSSSVNLQTVNVNIEDDDLLETDEMFSALLALENPDTDSRIQLQPDLVDIIILDEDGKCLTIILTTIKNLHIKCPCSCKNEVASVAAAEFSFRISYSSSSSYAPRS